MKTQNNKVELTGFAGTDPEVRELSKNAKIAQFSLATSEGYRDKTGNWINNTSWHRIVLWNANAEKACKEISKGTKLCLTGKINYRSYQASTGEKRYVTEIVVTDYNLIPKE